MIVSPICEMIGIEYPIFQGGMAWIADGKLAAAVSNGGGLGIISAMNAGGDYLREQIRIARELTDKPFGVNIMLMSPHVDEVAKIVAEEKVAVVTTGAGMPKKYMGMWKEANITVIPVVASVAAAKMMEKAGASAVIAEGGESGGHIGEMTTMPLVPQVCDAVNIPVLAAGGIGDGRGMAAAFMLGAVGVQMGTRFLLAEECGVHQNYKDMVLKATDISTVTTGRRFGGNTCRCLKNPFSREFLKVEYAPETTAEDVAELGVGALRKAAVEGWLLPGRSDLRYGEERTARSGNRERNRDRSGRTAERSCKMGKIAFVFSGQGAQKAGMGKDFYENNESVKELFARAEEIRPGTLQQCFEGTAEELKITENTQPCLYLADIAAAIALREEGIVPEAVAGFSLGEIPALAFAGAYSPEDGFRLACARGAAMGKAAKEHPASMVAVMKMENAQVEALAEKYPNVFPVNYNGPGQLVVAGKKDELDSFGKDVKEAGGRCLPVAVGGGFHSPFMDEASQEFAEALKAVDVKQPEMTVYSNYTTKPYTAEVRDLMEKQINHSLRWQESIENMAADGFDTFIEVGVGTTLKKLISRILPDSKVYAVSNMEEARQVAEEVR